MLKTRTRITIIFYFIISILKGRLDYATDLLKYTDNDFTF